MNTANAIVIAAAILGLSIVGGAVLLGGSVDQHAEELAGLGQSISKIQVAGGAAPAAAAAPSRRRGPDPDKAYTVNTKGSPFKGPEDAKITLIEFSDFQCPFCGRVTPTLDQINRTYPKDVKIVFKHLPLRIHPKAPLAHAASEAAHRQGKFWEMHDKIFANQRAMSEENYVLWAGEIGLDVERFEKDMKSAAIKARVDADAAEAASLGVSGTPGFFVNGKFLSGAKPFSEFKRLIDAELAG